jgi:hypothetical protein
MSENNENDENDEIEDVLGRILFPEPILDNDDDCDEYYLKCINAIEDTNIVEKMFLENKRFKNDEECCSNNNNNDNINNLGIKQLSHK